MRRRRRRATLPRSPSRARPRRRGGPGRTSCAPPPGGQVSEVLRTGFARGSTPRNKSGAQDRGAQGDSRTVRSWSRRSPDSVARPVAQFAVASLIAVLFLGLVGVFLLRQVGRGEAIHNATEVTRLAAIGIVQPTVAPGLLRGDPDAIERVDRAARALIDRDDGITRVKIWRADGTILYSDVPEQIDTRFPLGAKELEILRDGGVDAEVSQLDRAENRFEQDDDRLLEVYLQIRAPDGEPLLFESYQRFSSVTEDTRRLVVTLLPAAFGGLLVLALLQL